MLFNSLIFPFFLFCVLTLYWCLNKKRHRNLLLLFASYLFYGLWDYRFIALIVFSSTVNYFCGLAIARQKSGVRSKYILFISLICNLGLLGFFKYFNFFAQSFESFLVLLGVYADWPTLNIILPVGISFYTFQSLSYTIDVYRGKCPVCKDALSFFLFVAFFPQLVAGPIERANRLLPQFQKENKFDKKRAELGLRYILYGFFLKLAIADNLALVVNPVYADVNAYSGLEILFAVYCFAFQIYGDFAGYSYIAIGTASLFNIHLRQNFRSPYFSQSVKEFWTRWHMSLMSWFKDYFYIFSLGGKKVPPKRHKFNVLTTFTVSGLWHGANWTFIFWGLMNGAFYFFGDFFKGKNFILKVLNVLITFHLICLGWIFFRAEDLSQGFELCARILSSSNFSIETLMVFSNLILFILLSSLLIAEYVQRKQKDIVYIDRFSRPVRFGAYYMTGLLIFFAGQFSRVPFIYFQF